MNRFAVTLASTAFIALALVASATNAAPPASMECPSAFQLKSVNSIVEEFDVDPSAVEVIDANENRFVCLMRLPEHSPRSPIFINVIDDVAFAKKP
jgi:hypothetical protein